MKYPIGIQNFEKVISDGYTYLDKTDLIYKLVHSGDIYFLSRPRRFGKSLLVSTLKCYFEGKKELFNGLAIDSLEKDWKQYPIFHIDFNGNNFTNPDELTTVLEGYVASQEAIYGKSPVPATLGGRFAYVLKAAHEKTGLRAVVLIDEYDKPILDVLDTNIKIAVSGDDRLLESYNREILKGFYSVFKAADQDLQFVLLTGVTKFSQVSVFSGFNQPNDISMDEDYEALCGITEEELYATFDEPIKAMAVKFKLTEEEMKYRIKRKFDGYHFSANMLDIYNPFSVLSALSTGKIQDYWFRTGTPTYLIRLLNHTNENLNELTGKYYDTSEFIDYKADVERPLPMIYQSGYLTIKDYDPFSRSYLLDLPNNEVKKGFLTLIASNYLGSKDSAGTLVIQLVRALRNDDIETWRKSLTAFFASIPYTMRRKENEQERERYFHYTFYLIFRILSTYVTLTEMQQSEGRADCVIETDRVVYIFEFKLDGTAQQALQQIEAKGYAKPYLADKRTLRKIGVNFSSETGTIEEWVEA